MDFRTLGNPDYEKSYAVKVDRFDIDSQVRHGLLEDPLLEQDGVESRPEERLRPARLVAEPEDDVSSGRVREAQSRFDEQFLGIASAPGALPLEVEALG